VTSVTRVVLEVLVVLEMMPAMLAVATVGKRRRCGNKASHRGG
jgi:hypothetical protein